MKRDYLISLYRLYYLVVERKDGDSPSSVFIQHGYSGQAFVTDVFSV